MNCISKLGLGVAIGLLAAACSSSNSGSSSGTSTTGETTSGGSTGAGTGAASGAETGAAAGAATGAASGSTSGAATGAASGATTGATTGAASGATTGATTGAASGATTGAASGAASGASSGATTLPTVASVQALCTEANSPYHGGTMAFTPSQFCVLFESICAGDIIAAAGFNSTESDCETTYAGLPATGGSPPPMECRTEHLCNANVSVASENPHCFHVQGWGSATSQVGSPCM
jgi:hypothetical protein